MSTKEFDKIINDNWPRFGQDVYMAEKRRRRNRDSLRNIIMGALFIGSSFTGFALGNANVAGDKEHLADIDRSIEEKSASLAINKDVFNDDLASLGVDCQVNVQPFMGESMVDQSTVELVEGRIRSMGSCTDQPEGFMSRLRLQNAELLNQQFSVDYLSQQREKVAKDVANQAEPLALGIAGAMASIPMCIGVWALSKEHF